MYSEKEQTPISSPKGIDKVIANINLQLGDLTWLTKTYQRAWVLKDSTVAQKFVAKIYLQNGEYIEPIPQDNEMGISVVMVTSPETNLINEPNTDTFEAEKRRDIAIIFGVNLKEIDPSKDYVFTEELKEGVELQLEKVDRLQVNSYVDEDYRQVFAGLNITEFNILQYPYAAFRFNCTVFYGGYRNC
jgi:hypothetical protein